MEEVIKKKDIELEFGKSNNKIFMILDKEDKLWLDTKGLTSTAFLCASLDGISMISCGCGKNGKLKRMFVPIDWVIDEWDGPKDIVEAVKKQKETTSKRIPELREKHGS